MKKLIGKGLLCVYFLCFFSVAMLFFGITGSAYIDPSAMTYLIQLIAGVIVAVGAIAGVIWRKTRKNVKNKLGIEDKVEIESDDLYIKEDKK